MSEDNRIELSKYRYEKAIECLNSAKVLVDHNDFRGAVNRAYYAIFHSLRSILALDMVEFKKHSGNISYFRQNYIKDGVLDVELSRVLSLASETRNSSDYDDFFVISKDEVNNLIIDAERFCTDVADYLRERNPEIFG
ncbi:MAG: HEPN domain-containing protein [Eubacterium sp.]|nr:HEPN domain-containing protein [Eubacterium sp.]MBR1674979.1 HEPN domain-containing protein [Eubacterium sp.]